jgi:hypothetical protein
MVCFGVGYAFSMRKSSWNTAGRLSFIYIFGGILSAWGYDAVRSFAEGPNVHFDWLAGLTLRKPLPCAGFVIPFICITLLYNVFRRVIQTNAAWRYAWMVSLTAVGIAIDEVNRRGNFFPILIGFPCFGAIFLFFIGLLIGEFWLSHGRLPINHAVGIYSSAFALVVTTVFVRFVFPSVPNRVPWKMSGALSYLPIGALVAFLSLVLVQHLLGAMPSRLGTVLAYLGRNSTMSLVYTLTVVPIAGRLSLFAASSYIRDGLYLAFIGVSLLVAVILSKSFQLPAQPQSAS